MWKNRTTVHTFIQSVQQSIHYHAQITLHHKDNELYATGYLNMPSVYIMYTMYIKGHFRSAECLNNCIDANKKRSGRREGSWHQTQSHRYGDGAVLCIQLPPYCPTLQSQPSLAERVRGRGSNEDENGVNIAQMARRGKYT